MNITALCCGIVSRARLMQAHGLACTTSSVLDISTLVINCSQFVTDEYSIFSPGGFYV